MYLILGISVATSVVPVVTLPYVSTVTFGYVPAVTPELDRPIVLELADPDTATPPPAVNVSNTCTPSCVIKGAITETEPDNVVPLKYPEAEILPATSKALVGEAVPIPTLVPSS